MLNNRDMLVYTLAFVIPGFIIYSVSCTISPQKNEQAPNSILKFLLYSCINYALWGGWIFAMLASSYYKDHPYITAFIWSIAILITPVIIGILLGLLNKHTVLKKFFEKFNINIVHPAPAAWDYIFGNVNGHVYVIVILKDGSEIYGYFSSNSFASTDSSERDLYLEKQFRNNNGVWEQVPNDMGVYVKADQIKHIEFKR